MMTVPLRHLPELRFWIWEYAFW